MLCKHSSTRPAHGVESRLVVTPLRYSHPLPSWVGIVPQRSSTRMITGMIVTTAEINNSTASKSRISPSARGVTNTEKEPEPHNALEVSGLSRC